MRLQESELVKSIEYGGDVYKKAENRKGRDMSIAAVGMMIPMGIVLTGYLGADASSVSQIGIERAADAVIKSMFGGYGMEAVFGSLGDAVAMMGSPIARIQNWFERRKVKKEISKAGEEKKKAYSEYKEANK